MSKTTVKEHIIFDSEGRDFEEAKKCIIEQDTYLGTPLDEIDLSDERVWDWINSERELDFDAEQANLDKELDGRILVIADLGLWHGRRSAYKICNSRNLNEVLNQAQGDYYRVTCDRYNVVARDSHHDGTNYYTFRELKEDTNYEVLLNKLYNQEEVTSRDISRYTKSLRPHVKAVYGW